VLVVDDDVSVLSVTAAILRRSGFRVVCASSPDEALGMIALHRDIGVAIVDVVLPEMTGFDLAEELRRVAPPTRVVFMSGVRSDHMRQAVDDLILPKPFTGDMLVATVSAALAN
jgi:DNA-binding response OmpR family regulator